MQTLTHQYWLVKERQMELLAESQRQALIANSERTTSTFVWLLAALTILVSIISKGILYLA
jgi:Ca2+/H+ antiporter